MTERKNFKRLVRERMRRTGETYTTARRHVLAKVGADSAAGRLPAGLVAGYDTFGVTAHRQSALVAHLLRQAGVTAPHTGEAYSEAMIAGLAGGIGFMYMIFEYQNTPPVMTIVAQHHPQPWAPAALDRLGIPYAETRSGAAPAALARLRKALDRHRAALCTVARDRLPWHGMEPGFDADPYDVVVAGADGDTLLVDDEAYAPREVSAADFCGAWSAHKKGRHHSLELADTLPPASEVDLAAAIKGAIGTTVGHLTGPVLGNNFDVNFGFSGMAKLVDQLRDTRTRTGWERRFGAPVPFFHAMRRLHDCLELEYTAPGATRAVYADYLDEAAPVLGSAELPEAAALFRRSAAGWSDLAARALAATAALGEYAELVERRLTLLCAQGPAAREKLAGLNAKIDELAAADAADAAETAGTGAAGAGERRELFAELADQVAECLSLERRAVDVLTTATG
jgi:hypothetical protein